MSDAWGKAAVRGRAYDEGFSNPKGGRFLKFCGAPVRFLVAFLLFGGFVANTREGKGY